MRRGLSRSIASTPRPTSRTTSKVEMLYIDAEECIDCDACVEACPVDACFAEDQLPDEWQKYAADQRRSTTRPDPSDGGCRACAAPDRGACAAIRRAHAPGAQHPRPSAVTCRRSGLGAGGGIGGSTDEHRQLERRRRSAARSARAAPALQRLTEAGSSGAANTTGVPASDCSRSGIVSGTVCDQRHAEVVGQRLASALAKDREVLAPSGA